MAKRMKKGNLYSLYPIQVVTKSAAEKAEEMLQKKGRYLYYTQGYEWYFMNGVYHLIPNC